jgi:hypothetical protein
MVVFRAVSRIQKLLTEWVLLGMSNRVRRVFFFSSNSCLLFSCTVLASYSCIWHCRLSKIVSICSVLSGTSKDVIPCNLPRVQLYAANKAWLSSFYIFPSPTLRRYIGSSSKMLSNTAAWKQISPLEHLIARACDVTLPEPNYAVNLEVADYINNKKANTCVCIRHSP